MMCGTSNVLANTATSSTLSGTRGANVDVVVQMHNTFSAPTLSTARRMPATSVPKASVPSTGFSSTTTGVRPAAPIALKHDFWSILDHTTYLPAGRNCRWANSTRVIVNPVAVGSTQQAFAALMPAMRMASKERYRVKCTITDEPAALGCSAMTSPLRPMPWASPKCRSRTNAEMTRPSRSPTPTLPMKLLVSNDASSSRNERMAGSSHPLSGNLRCDNKVVICADREFRDCSACNA
mmetsp:Transcript_70140/g.196562  ORF Transcript_70140/g.196562 Transcript_70140/m.196562 type:complete len:237 (+) Transcript_70140:1056-1766(+)